jgi:hypothetical protein
MFLGEEMNATGLTWRRSLGALFCLLIPGLLIPGLLIPGLLIPSAAWAQAEVDPKKAGFGAASAKGASPEPAESPVPPVRLEFESVSTTGGVPEDEALWGLEKQPRLLACYGKSTDDWSGEFTMALDVNGKVTKVRAHSKKGATADCLKRGLKFLDFHNPKAVEAKVSAKVRYVRLTEDEKEKERRTLMRRDRRGAKPTTMMGALGNVGHPDALTIRVEYDDIAVDAGLSNAAIANTFGRLGNDSGILACHDRHGDEDWKSRLELSFDATGRPTKIDLTDKDDPLATCIIEQIRRIRFPLPREGETAKVSATLRIVAEKNKEKEGGMQAVLGAAKTEPETQATQPPKIERDRDKSKYRHAFGRMMFAAANPQHALMDCYESQLEEQSELAGAYATEIKVDYYGRVTEVNTTKNELGSSFGSCAEEVWWATPLFRPKEYPATLTLHYEFTPERENK